ncbi:MAG: glycosyltransferase family 39 protein, partial [Rikenellaceae bacterium]|nr:glycosyltransferase family 39 protein [Rikenellaceae bacterium]
MTEPFYLSKSDRLLQIPGIHYLILLVVCFFAFFVNNQVIPADLMEARNLATAQEMVREGNYLVPTLNGELRLEKPPLPTWIAAALEQVWPGDLSIQRYAAGLVATLLVIFLYLMSGRLTGNRNLGLICALILATCFNIVLMGRTATWDIYCHSFMMAAIYFMVTAFRQTGPQWKNFLGAGFFMGLSFLGKGPVSFYALLLPFLMSYGWVYRPSLKQKGYSLAGMIAVCLLVSCWWMGYLYIFPPEMALSLAEKE